MKKIFCFLALIFLCFPVNANAQVSAQSAIVIDSRNGFALYEKNADEKRSMASTTKIMTALLTLEAAELCDEVLEITDEMVKVEGSSMGLLPGYRLKLSDLAVGMLLASGNDAANAAAVFLGGSVSGFCEIMNAKARLFGMNNTSFETPSGLDGENHYSTARDMAALASYALKNERFASIVSSESLKVNFVSPEFTAYYQNHNKLLRLYDGCIGVKTGFTKKSGRCLVSAAKKNAVTLIAVTLNAPDDWNDHIALLNDSFLKFENKIFDEEQFQVDVVGSKTEKISAKAASYEIPLASGEEVQKDIYLPKFLYAPVEKGEVIGKVVYSMGENEIASCDIVCEEYCAREITENKETFLDKIKEFFGELFK